MQHAVAVEPGFSGARPSVSLPVVVPALLWWVDRVSSITDVLPSVKLGRDPAVDHIARMRDVLFRHRGKVAPQEWMYVVCWRYRHIESQEFDELDIVCSG